jgi:hypothetical protein
MLQERLLDPECVVPQVLVSLAEVTKSCGSDCCKNPETGIDQNSHFCAPPHTVSVSSSANKHTQKKPAIVGGVIYVAKTDCHCWFSTRVSRVWRRHPVSRTMMMINVPTARIHSMMISSCRFISAPSHFKQYEIK